MRLIRPDGPGLIIVPTGAGWDITSVYLVGPMPVIVLLHDNNIQYSYFVFPNEGKIPTAEGCRDTLVSGILSDPKFPKVTDKQLSASKLKDGTPVALETFLIPRIFPRLPMPQENVFAIVGNANTCVGAHFTRIPITPPPNPLLADVQSTIESLTFDLSYTPVSSDYGYFGYVLLDQKDFRTAALYYRRALDTTSDAPAANIHRILVDELSMCLGEIGDQKENRKVLEAAIASDPDYPFYYYNLALMDAFAGDAAAARSHLQLAFDRRANTLKGDHLPDPTQDAGLLKLKHNKEFWLFVEALPKN
ncbi:MAG: tetratricopeptide repeat protein [Acidobacteriaceae bacterium]